MFSAFADGREERDLPLSLHHVAWFWCPRISGILLKLPLQCAGIWSVRGGSWAGCGALQRWNWTLRDILISWYLCGPRKFRSFLLIKCFYYISQTENVSTINKWATRYQNNRDSILVSWLSLLYCPVQMDKRKDPSSVDIKNILLDMRKYRMGLIQTPDQLRFSYMAVLEGAKHIMGDSTVQVPARHTHKHFIKLKPVKARGRHVDECLTEIQYHKHIMNLRLFHVSWWVSLCLSNWREKNTKVLFKPHQQSLVTKLMLVEWTNMNITLRLR